MIDVLFFFFFQAEDGIRDADVTGVQTCALPISLESTLLRMRLVTPDQIASAMREEAETGRPIAEIVVANGWVSADDLARLQNTAPAPAAVVAPAPEPVVAAPAPPPAPVAEPTP